MTSPDHPDPQVQRLLEAVNAIGVNIECPSCGHPEWAPFGGTVVLPLSGAQPDPEPEGAECLPLACKRCGFVRLHAAQVLEES